jgi:ribosomal-protein-alanine N-acetyltransferase
MKPLQSPKPTIEKMTLQHIDEVVKIEQLLYSDPWSKKSFLYEVVGNQFSAATVMLLDNRIIGYCIVWKIFGEFHIANIAIHPDYQGRGYGTYLLTEILKKNDGMEYAILEVRESNQAAIHIYEKLGFIKISKRYSYYSNGEDALVMRKLFKHPQEKSLNMDKLIK